MASAMPRPMSVPFRNRSISLCHCVSLQIVNIPKIPAVSTKDDAYSPQPSHVAPIKHPMSCMPFHR